MNRCHFCGENINEIPFECRRCGNIFCSNHHLPENHNCPGIQAASSFKYISQPVGKKKNQSVKGNIRRNLTLKNFLISCGAIFLLVFAILFLSGVIVSGLYPHSQTIIMPHPTQSPRPVLDRTALELDIHQLINQQRTSHGLSSLSFDQALSDIARKHSLDMARSGYFDHVNLQGLDPTERASKSGYSCYKNYGSYYTNGISENIFFNNQYSSMTLYNGRDAIYDWNTQEEIAQSTVNGWMSSPGHRQNILTPTYDREGIGVEITDSNVYITEDFC